MAGTTRSSYPDGSGSPSLSSPPDLPGSRQPRQALESRAARILGERTPTTNTPRISGLPLLLPPSAPSPSPTSALSLFLIPVSRSFLANLGALIPTTPARVDHVRRVHARTYALLEASVTPVPAPAVHAVLRARDAQLVDNLAHGGGVVGLNGPVQVDRPKRQAARARRIIPTLTRAPGDSRSSGLRSSSIAPSVTRGTASALSVCVRERYTRGLKGPLGESGSAVSASGFVPLGYFHRLTSLALRGRASTGPSVAGG